QTLNAIPVGQDYGQGGLTLKIGFRSLQSPEPGRRKVVGKHSHDFGFRQLGLMVDQGIEDIFVGAGRRRDKKKGQANEAQWSHHGCLDPASRGRAVLRAALNGSFIFSPTSLRRFRVPKIEWSI